MMTGRLATDERWQEVLIDAIGEDAFCLLSENYGGLRIYVPENVDRSTLPSVMGRETAALLAARYPNDYIRVPLSKEWRALRYREAGITNRAIARRLGMTENGVMKIFQRDRRRGSKLADPRKKAERRPDLFD